MTKALAGVFLIIGAMIGGGILAIPIVSVKFGFMATLAFIIAAYLLMTKTGLFVLSLSLECKEVNNTYYSIIGNNLGKLAQKISIILYLWLLFVCLASYISGCVSLIMSADILPYAVSSHLSTSILYTIVFGGLVMLGAKVIVRMNAAIVTLKLALLLVILYVCSTNFKTFDIGMRSLSNNGAFSLFFITVNAFAFQYIVPSLVNYYGKDQAKMLKKIIIAGSSSVFVLYAAWLLAIYSLIPMDGQYGLMSIYHSSNQLLAFNNSLVHYIQSPYVLNILSVFQIISLFGSFFCVALAIVDILKDMIGPSYKFAIAFITFVPSLLLSLGSENMYVYAMAAAGYISFVLEIILPTLAYYPGLRVALKKIAQPKEGLTRIFSRG